ncbi:unnamed protein product, partial [Amoebophrya sp. A25]
SSGRRFFQVHRPGQMYVRAEPWLQSARVGHLLPLQVVEMVDGPHRMVISHEDKQGAIACIKIRS